VTETTRNRGKVATAASETRFYLSTFPTLDATALLLGARAVPALVPGQSSTATTLVAIPATVGTEGSYYLLVVADGAGTVAEADETNNVGSWPIKIGPDLTVSGLSGPGSAERGATIVVTNTVRNRGAAPAAASTTRYYLSTKKTYDASAMPLTFRAVPALEAGAQDQASTPITLPAGVGGRTFYVLVIADGDGAIVETIETNNLKYLPVVIP
jgi:subtilase family serine protease